LANNWNIPAGLEQEIRARDTVCVYCRQPFTSTKVAKRSAASWEHIVNDETIITLENIALCCCGCNASKGQKGLSLWLQSDYCKTHGIGPDTVAPVIRAAITRGL
jgi:5-methylcytosine-specific restriction endonuclease McrA